MFEAPCTNGKCHDSNQIKRCREIMGYDKDGFGVIVERELGLSANTCDKLGV